MTDSRHASTTGAWRLGRGLVVGLCASGLGALGHVLGGGELPSLAVVALLSAGIAAVCVAASRFQWSLLALVVVLLVAQPVFHLAFGWYAGLAAPDGTAGQAGHHGMHHGGGMHAEHTAAPDEAGWQMTALHVLVGLVTAVVLRHGERWLRGLLDALTMRLLRVLEAVTSLATPRRPALVPARVRPLPAYDPAAAWHVRGPPAP